MMVCFSCGRKPTDPCQLPDGCQFDGYLASDKEEVQRFRTYLIDCANLHPIQARIKHQKYEGWTDEETRLLWQKAAERVGPR